MSEGNNSYRTAFWVMATIATVGMIILGTGMISNDRMRASEDLRIDSNSISRDNMIKDLMVSKLDNVLDRLVRIEVRLERNVSLK